MGPRLRIGDQFVSGRANLVTGGLFAFQWDDFCAFVVPGKAGPDLAALARSTFAGQKVQRAHR